jgi:hypothetical protein
MLGSCDLAKDTGSSGDGSLDWKVSGLSLGPDGLNYAEVSGTVTLQSALAGYGTTAEVRFYQDEYQTLITSTTESIGNDLSDEGATQVFNISHYEVYVKPAISGYDKVCAEFRADQSNYDSWTQVGCLEGQD